MQTESTNRAQVSVDGIDSYVDELSVDIQHRIHVLNQWKIEQNQQNTEKFKLDLAIQQLTTELVKDIRDARLTKVSNVENMPTNVETHHEDNK